MSKMGKNELFLITVHIFFSASSLISREPNDIERWGWCQKVCFLTFSLGHIIKNSKYKLFGCNYPKTRKNWPKTGKISVLWAELRNRLEFGKNISFGSVYITFIPSPKFISNSVGQFWRSVTFTLTFSYFTMKKNHTWSQKIYENLYKTLKYRHEFFS